MKAYQVKLIIKIRQVKKNWYQSHIYSGISNFVHVTHLDSVIDYFITWYKYYQNYLEFILTLKKAIGDYWRQNFPAQYETSDS